MPRTLRLLVVVGALAGLIAALNVGAAHAASKPFVAVADPGTSPFTQGTQLFRNLRLKKTRIVVPWNAALNNDPVLDGILKRDRSLGLEPLVHFTCAASPCTGRNKPPSVSNYTKGVKAFHKKYAFVKVLGAYNEGNHSSYGLRNNPKRAAEYFNALQKVCKSCKIVAADLLDDGSLEGWFKKWAKTAKNPKIIGFHNYGDANDQVNTGTRRLFALLQKLNAKRGQDPKKAKIKQEVWMTETGGIFYFKSKGKVVRKASESRQAKSLKFMFSQSLRKEFQGRIKRIYVFHWLSPGPDPKTSSQWFDAGLLNNNATPRKGYSTVASALKSGKFAR
jgi:hypothetical protein